uniref:hypothetical protein n=1 Tax=Nocardia amamiensis TaxID=404578 RepID=UPI001C3F9E93
HQLERQLVGIHRRSFRHSTLLPADLLAPFAMHTPLACSDYYGASAPPEIFSRRRAYPALADGFRSAGTISSGSRVHQKSIDRVGTQLCSGSIAMATPQSFTMASSPARLAGFGVDHP